MFSLECGLDRISTRPLCRRKDHTDRRIELKSRRVLCRRVMSGSDVRYERMGGLIRGPSERVLPRRTRQRVGLDGNRRGERKHQCGSRSGASDPRRSVGGCHDRARGPDGRLETVHIPQQLRLVDRRGSPRRREASKRPSGRSGPPGNGERERARRAEKAGLVCVVGRIIEERIGVG